MLEVTDGGLRSNTCHQYSEFDKDGPRLYLLPAKRFVLPCKDLLLETQYLGTNLAGELLVHSGGRDKVLGDGFLDLSLDDRRDRRREGTGDLGGHLRPNEHTFNLVRQVLWTRVLVLAKASHHD